jgi:hypothetical protein
VKKVKGKHGNWEYEVEEFNDVGFSTKIKSNEYFFEYDSKNKIIKTHMGDFNYKLKDNVKYKVNLSFNAMSIIDDEDNRIFFLSPKVFDFLED